MKVSITDIITSIRLYQEYGWHGLKSHQEPLFEWQGRIDKLSDEQIEAGKIKNPMARIFSITEFRKMDNDTEYLKYDEQYTARIWPCKNSLGLFMHYQYPAYTSLPEGVNGTFIEVDIDEDDE